MKKNIKDATVLDLKVYRNGLLMVGGAVAGIGHLGANGLRKAGVNDTDSVSEASTRGFYAPAKALDYMVGEVTLTTTEIKECEVIARMLADDSGQDYDVLLAAEIISAKKAKASK